jgi:D-alanine-D-alanine ligase
MSDVAYPVIVKPKMEAVSFGLRVVHTEQELRDAVAFIVSEFEQQALVEQFIPGREFAVGLLGNSPVEALPVLEIDLEGDPDAIQTVDDKRKTPREKICPAKIPEAKAEEMRQLSIAAFGALQLRDFCRVDIRMAADGQIYLLEINSMASLGLTGSYVNAAATAGYDYDALVNRMLDVASVRYFATSQTTTQTTSTGSKVPLITRIRGFLRGRQGEVEDLLKALVSTNTHVRNVDGVNALGAMLIKQLAGMGFSHEVYPQVEIGNQLFFTNSEEGSYDLLLLANLDNNTRLSRQKPFSCSQTRLTGSGVWENKGGLAVMTAALKALRFTRRLKKMRLGILLTSDDTLRGKFARPLIKDKAAHAGAVLGLHGASADGGVVTSRSGAAVYSCRINLKETDDAVDVARAFGTLGRLITQWTELSDAESGLVVVPADVEAESNIMVHYAHGEATLSVRFNDPEQFDTVDQEVRRLVKKRRSRKWSIELEGGQRRPPMIESEGTEKLWSVIQSIAADMDIRICREHRWSSADICFVEGRAATVDGLGPVGSMPEGQPEYILRHSLLERSALLAMTLVRLHRGALAT